MGSRRDDSRLPLEIKQAVICNNGEMEDEFKYIMKLRENNQLAKRSQFKQSMKKGLMKTVGSFTQCKIIGHLFDTQGINAMMDTLVQHQMQFNFI